MNDPIEVKHLSQITEQILEQINHVAKGLKSRRENLLEARRSMAKATGIIRDFDDVALLTMYAGEVAQVTQAYGEISKRLKILQRLLHSPYFARIDFVEDGFDLEHIYIGRHSLMDEKTHAYYIYDWRAPISSMYYDHGVGRASFTIPPDINGTPPPIEGEILLKRQFQIENGELVYSFDSDLAVEDDILRLELSKISDAKIKTIIHSIQKEQNTAIRSEDKDILVFGPAGSGKTSVGLHRLAYLLYRHRETLSSARVRIFSPSPIFASYIEGIIPDLGEDDVETLDFPSLIEKYLPGKRAFHDQYKQIEYLAKAPINDPWRCWLNEKYSSGFIMYLEEYIKNYSPSFEAITFNRDILCAGERLASLYTDRTTAGTLASKTSRIITHVNQRYDEYFLQSKQSITELFNTIRDDNFSTGEIRRLFEEERSIVLADLRSRLMPKAKRIYEKVLIGWAKKRRKETGNNNLPIGFAKEALSQEKLYFEDALMLMYIDILIGRIPQEKQVKHILLDEAQDVCILQHCILKRLFANCHFTILGDTNQALYHGINMHNQAEIVAEYPKAKVIPLTTSYRSTYEISRFAANVLADGHEIDLSSLYMRSGDEPVLIKTLKPAVATLDIIKNLPKGYKTVGILLTTAHAARTFYDDLMIEAESHENIPPIKLIADTNAGFAPGLMVMALPFAKGLEFDAVICPEYGQDVFDGQFGQKMLYLTCTRALHQLYLIQV